MPETKTIKDWNDLIGLESEKYKLEIDTKLGCGHIRAKDSSSDLSEYYLSTHTFYKNNYKGCEKILRKCGFNVKLQSWDKDE